MKNVASVTEELDVQFYLIFIHLHLNRHMLLVATKMNNADKHIIKF